MITCRSCRELAIPIMMRRPQVPFSALLANLVTYPLAGEGLQTFLIGGITFGVFKLAWLPGSLLATGLTAAFLFQVIYSSFQGRKILPDFSDVRDFTHFIGQPFRGLVALALAVLPYWLYVWLRFHPTPVSDGPFNNSSYMYTILHLAEHDDSPVAIALIAVGLVWAPVGLMLGAIDSSLNVMVNPFVSLRFVRQMGRDFGLAVGVFWVLVAAWFWLGSLADGGAGRMPSVILLALLELPRFYIAIMAARVLGILLYVHGAELGYGREEDYLLPVLGDVQPVDEPEPDRHVPEARDVSAVDLQPVAHDADEDDFRAYQPGNDVEAIELPELPRPAHVAFDRPARPAPASSAEEQKAEDLMGEEEFLQMFVERDGRQK